MKQLFSKILFIIVFLLILRLADLYINNYETFNNQKVPNVKWPFLNLQDDKGNNINMLVLRAYVEDEKDKKFLIEQHNKGTKFLGCSSNQSFPRFCDNPYGNCNNKDYAVINNKTPEEYVLGWAHCFKNPKEYISNKIPKILLSESDFTDYDYIKPDDTKIKYDYICYNPKDESEKPCEIGWFNYYKNWDLCSKVIQVLTDEYGLKGKIVGREGCDINIKNKHLLDVVGMLPYDEFMIGLKSSRFMLLPNLEEASPRVLTESLSFNKPVLVYEHILGGWKYINSETGMFFNETNMHIIIKTFLEKLEKNEFNPRKYYIDNYGLQKSGKILKDFIIKVYPDIEPEIRESKYIRFAIS